MYGVSRTTERVYLRHDMDIRTVKRMYGMARVRAVNSTVRAMEEC